MANKEYGKRAYKDTVFVDLFAKDITARENFISLYNALHDEQIDPATAKITPVVLEHVLYHGYFNDVSMLVNDKIVVFAEHQSTINENMPLRFLGYVSRVYEQMLDSRKRFARKPQMLPTPEFYVFYNGKSNYPKEKTLKLSDSFLEKEKLKNSQPSLEIIVKVVNINVEVYSDILAKCKPLSEYSSFVDIVRKYSVTGDGESFSLAIQKAIDAGILSDYLVRRRKEVENMVTGMYDYDLDMEVQREEAREEGIAIGEERGIAQGEYNARIETARAFLKLGVVTNEQIAQATGLPLAEVRRLAN